MDDCRVYWGVRGCDLPRGHDSEQEVRTHRQLQPVEDAVTAHEACLFGEYLTDEERRIVAQFC